MRINRFTSFICILSILAMMIGFSGCDNVIDIFISPDDLIPDDLVYEGEEVVIGLSLPSNRCKCRVVWLGDATRI